MIPRGPGQAILMALALCLACSAAWATTGTIITSPHIEAAEGLLRQNLSIGDALAGAPATPEQAAEADRLVAEGLSHTQALLAKHPTLPVARHLRGMLLCIAYHPAQPAPADARGDDLHVLRRGSADRSQLLEGLAELLTAIDVAFYPSAYRIDYRLDYAEALLICEEPNAAVAQLISLAAELCDMPGIRGRASPSQEARFVALLQQALRDLDLAADEPRWLRQVLAVDPGNSAAVNRLAELEHPTPSGIVWQAYQAGRTAAEQQGKPVLLHFHAEPCDWCQKLEREVFSDPDLIQLSRRFVCIKVDALSRGDLTRAHRVDAFPTAVILDPAGAEAGRIEGYLPPARYLEAVNQTLPSNDRPDQSEVPEQ